MRCRDHGRAGTRLSFPGRIGICKYSAAAMAPDRSTLVTCGIRDLAQDVFDKAESNVQ